MSRLRLTTLVLAFADGLGALAAAADTLRDIPVSYLFSPSGKLTQLKAGVAYRASDFPLPFRVTPPDGSWGGAQWKANQFPPSEIALRHLTCSSNPKVCARPYYGWVTLGQGFSQAGPPRSLIVVMSSFSRTPSVATTVANLHRGKNVEYQSASGVKVGRFAGVRFDGQTAGARHAFIPFAPPTPGHALGDGAGDAVWIEGVGHPFRYIVLNERGKTVVVMIGSLALSPDESAAYLAKTAAIVGLLRFPRSVRP
jgi:hypothetical protein